MKKIYIMIVLVLTGVMAMAQTSVWHGGKQPWSRGTGTESDPYLIESADQLAYLAYVVNMGYNTSGMFFRLTTDIDLNGSEDLQWVPIGLKNRYFNEDGCDRGSKGNPNTVFRGHFDGDEHSISNIYIDNSENVYGNYAGLFGYVEGEKQGQEVYPAVVENVYVVSGFIKGSCCGGIVAYGGSSNGGTVLVSRCWNGAAIESTSGTSSVGTGGIVGWSAYQVKNCYNVGTINGYVAGGIVGGGSATIEECYNDGDVSGTYSGGIFGFTLSGKDTINNCYNTGNVTAEGTPSGLSVSAGGIAGMKCQGNIVITNCYNVGSVSSTELSGCILAYGTNPVSPANNYYLNSCTGGEEGEALPEDYMRTQAFVDQLNSGGQDNVWGMDVNNLNNGFPLLVGNICSLEVTANPLEGGAVEGGGAYRFGTTATLTATANEGYTFVNWTKDEEEMSLDSTFSFVVSASGSYVANFSLMSYEVTAIANPVEGGEITGTGSYQYGSTATVTVIPNSGYQFNHWTKNGAVVSEESSYSFVVTEDSELVANLVGIGVDEWDASAIKVYPNPTHGMITVETVHASSLQGQMEYRITDALGQALLRGAMKSEKQRIDIRCLSQGIYFIIVGDAIQKIVVE